MDRLALCAHDRPLMKHKDTEDRVKKGEWSEGSINALLDAYESKWSSRNRRNLKVGDWNEVARHVSIRSESRLQGGKTPSQCRHKIETMKKKYRSEVLESCNTGSAYYSQWPFFSRMDALFRCPTRRAGIPGGLDAGAQPVLPDLGFQDAVPQMESEDSEKPRLGREEAVYHDPNIGKDTPFSHFQLLQGIQNFQVQPLFQEEEQEAGLQDVEINGEDASNAITYKKENEARDSANAPVNNSDRGFSFKPTAKQRKQINSELAKSIQSFADSILKLEHAKMEMYKDTERLRVAAETKRAELELKRTEIMMNTQLQIAKLLSKNTGKRKKVNGDPITRTKAAEVAALMQAMTERMQSNQSK